MPNMSVGGLVSGLDTATIVSQLMQLEARPQTILKSRVSTEEKVVTALQALNKQLASIATKAADLSKSTGWSPATATSSNDKVTVTTDPGASTASLSFTVNSVATAARTSYLSQGTVNGSPTDNVMSAGVDYTITYDDGRAAEIINTGDGSIQDIADSINGTDGLRASLVRAGAAADGSPMYELHVVSTATGLNSGFSLTEGSDPANPPATPVAFMGGTKDTLAGTNAEITLAGQTSPLVFSSNTITDLMPGVDVTLLAGATGQATITLEKDVTKLVESVKAMVESVNTALGEIGTLTSYDAATKKAGLLTGDATLRSVRNQLLESVSRGLGGESLAAVGIQVDRYGKLTFDEAKFKAAHAADPAGTIAKFAGTDASAANEKDPYDAAYGIADRLKVLADNLSGPEGTITKAVQNRQSAIKGMEDDIADWDVRLETRRTTLQRQYTALETALGKLQSQSSWLAGQLASLPQMSSGQ